MDISRPLIRNLQYIKTEYTFIDRNAKQTTMHLSTIDIRKDYIQHINSPEIEVGAEFAQKMS